MDFNRRWKKSGNITVISKYLIIVMGQRLDKFIKTLGGRTKTKLVKITKRKNFPDYVWLSKDTVYFPSLEI